jgi:hypothetical protein
MLLKSLSRSSSLSVAVRTLSNRGTGRDSLCHGFSNNRAIYEQRKASPPVRSSSALAPIGVAAANRAAFDSSFVPHSKIFDEFSLKGRVGIVSGGNRGLGLEMALALCEAGATIYCFDLPLEPTKEWVHTKEYVRRMGNGSRLEYVCGNVTDQKGMWGEVKDIGDREGRMDICIAAAGIADGHTDCLDYPAEQLKQVGD